MFFFFYFALLTAKQYAFKLTTSSLLLLFSVADIIVLACAVMQASRKENAGDQLFVAGHRKMRAASVAIAAKAPFAHVART